LILYIIKGFTSKFSEVDIILEERDDEFAE